MKHDSLKQYVKLRRSLTAEKTKLESRLHAINQALNGTFKALSAKPAKKKRKMSAAGRAKIVAAQKARWARVKAKKRA
jgi:hypothetical protein